MAPKNLPNDVHLVEVTTEPLEVAVAFCEGMYDHFVRHEPTSLGAAQMLTVVCLLREAWDSILLTGNEADARRYIARRMHELALREEHDAYRTTET